MDIREKLVELLTDNLPRCGNLPRWDNPLQLSCDEQVQRIADHLIMNGVTVQEWISVKDRLPENVKEGLLIALRWGEVDIGWCEDGRWGSQFVDEYEDGEVTHWMPLPKPPKGE